MKCEKGAVWRRSVRNEEPENEVFNEKLLSNRYEAQKRAVETTEQLQLTRVARLERVVNSMEKKKSRRGRRAQASSSYWSAAPVRKRAPKASAALLMMLKNMFRTFHRLTLLQSLEPMLQKQQRRRRRLRVPLLRSRQPATRALPKLALSAQRWEATSVKRSLACGNPLEAPLRAAGCGIRM